MKARSKARRDSEPGSPRDSIAGTIAEAGDDEAVALEPLPHGWSWRTVGELAAPEPNAITDGPFGSKLKTEHYTPSGPRVIRLANIGDGEFIDARAHISEEHFAALQKHRVHGGDIVIAALGETLPRACLIPNDVGPAIVKADCIRFRPAKGYSSAFLNYALNSEGTRKRVASVIHGVGRPRLNLSEVKSIALPVARIDEQRRIVAEIEKEFTRLEAAQSLVERGRANLAGYRDALLVAACSGDLSISTSDWIDSNLGSVLLRIEAGKSFRCEERPPIGDETGVVKVSAVTWGEYNDDESKTCLDADRIEARFLVRAGDFLFSRANTIELVGACVIARNVTRRVMLSDKILRFHFVEGVDPRWVLYWLRSKFGRKEIERLSTGNQESMRNIGQDRIRQIAIRLPPLEEQKRLVAEIEHRLSVSTKTSAAVTGIRRRAEALRQAILQKAFSGHLV